MASASKLFQDLSSVPNIIGGLGLSIAAAQKALDLDYLNSVERIAAMARVMLAGIKTGANGPEPLNAEEQKRFDEMQVFLRELLTATAPSRYQFTETVLRVKLDLAQSMDAAGSGALGVGYAAVSVNASLTVGYSYDYRAAAECRTTLQAIPADPAAFAKLLDRAKEISDQALVLPDRSPVDQAIIDKQSALVEKLVGITAAAVTSAPPSKG